MKIRVHTEADEGTVVDWAGDFGNEDVMRGLRSMTLSDEL
jgi:hypothetical protein